MKFQNKFFVPYYIFYGVYCLVKISNVKSPLFKLKM